VRFAKHVIDPELPAISAIAADVDGDGRLDVIAAGGPSGGVSKWSNLVYWYQAPRWKRHPVCVLDPKAVILHIDHEQFGRSVAETTPAPAAVEISVDDGALGEIWWYRYDRLTKRWTGHIIVSPYVGAHGTASGDIDGDGWNDLLVPTQMGAPRNSMAWARNPGRPAAATNLWAVYPLATNGAVTGWQEYVRLADLNGDGRLDALHGSDGNDGWMGFWLQGAAPRGLWDERRLAGPMKDATNVDAADLNGDGRPDVVGTEGHGVGVWWFAAPDYAPRRIDATLKSTHSLALGDVNGDGATDIATCGYESRSVACFLNDGAGNFTTNILDRDQCAYDARLLDLDGDRDLDLLLSGQLSSNLVWYENLSPRSSGERGGRSAE
jgi:hypothetical protein